MRTPKQKTRLATLLVAVCLAGGAARGAVLYQEDFSGTDGGWYNRPSGSDWAASYDTFGNPGGSMGGQFGSLPIPNPEVGAWRADGAGATTGLMGDYLTGGFTAWRFQFYAADVLPSDLTFRFGDGANTFSRLIGGSVTMVDQWFTIEVPLTYGGWFGGSSLDFSNALSSVTFIDVQVTRNGSGSQFYYMDNFQTTQDVMGASVPEPATGLFWFGAVLLYGLRRHMNRQGEEA